MKVIMIVLAAAGGVPGQGEMITPGTPPVQTHQQMIEGWSSREACEQEARRVRDQTVLATGAT